MGVRVGAGVRVGVRVRVRVRARVSAIFTSQRHSMKMPGPAQCEQQPVRFAWSCMASTCRLEVRIYSFVRRKMSACGHGAPSLQREAKAETLNRLQRHCMHARCVLPVHHHARAAAAVRQRVGHRRR